MMPSVLRRIYPEDDWGLGVSRFETTVCRLHLLVFYALQRMRVTS